MAKFKIYGADKSTGEDVTQVIEAATPDEAELIASHRGVMVSRTVEVVGEDATVPPKDQTSGSIFSKRIIPEAESGSGQVAQGVLRAALWVFIIICLLAFLSGLAGG